MRIVTSGIGLRAGNLLTTLKQEMPEARILGYYDPRPTHLEMIGTETPRFPSVEAMLSDAKPDLYCVLSPNVSHLDQIRLGLEAGVPVFIEKPLVVSIEETLDGHLLAKHGGVNRAMVGPVLRYSQRMVDLRAALALGWLGEIASLEANEHIGPHHGAFFMRDWRQKAGLAGGFMLEKCCHDLDIYNMVTTRVGRRLADHDYTQGTAMKGAHYGADQLMCRDITAYLRGQSNRLPVSILDAMEAGIAAIALDEARITGQIVDLTETWANLDAHGLHT